MNIIYIAPNSKGSVASYRRDAFKAKYKKNFTFIHSPIDVGIKNLFFTFVFFYQKRIYKHPQIIKFNLSLLSLIEPTNDVGILIFDKPQTVSSETIKLLKYRCPNYVFVNYMVDNPFSRLSFGWSMFFDAIKLYDLHIVFRPSCENEYKKRELKYLSFDYGYWKKTDLVHTPNFVSSYNDIRFLFVGSFEFRRALFLLISSFVVPNKITIWGPNWGCIKYWPLFKCYGKELIKNGLIKEMGLHSHIFCFFNRRNRDNQNTRFFQILASYKLIITEKTNVTQRFLRDYPLQFENIFHLVKILAGIKRQKFEQASLLKYYPKARSTIKPYSKLIVEIIDEINRCYITNKK